MTSLKQIEANRRNAQKSTGPTSEEGKQRSRCNAVRHGLTAETVINALEDAEDYTAFEATVIADYDAQSAVERELVLRLASLLWRLRRMTAIETGLFEIQAEQLDNSDFSGRAPRALSAAAYSPNESSSPLAVSVIQPAGSAASPSSEIAACYLRLANLPSFALDRISRYETTLWRQVDQILFALDNLDRRKPQERRRPA